MHVREVSSSEISPTHGMVLKEVKDGIHLIETDEMDWHLASFDIPQMLGKTIVLSLTIIPTSACSTLFHVHHFGGRAITSIAADGRVLPGGLAQKVSSTPTNDGYRVEVTYVLLHPTLFFGMTDQAGAARYQGSGRPQWVVRDIAISERVLSANADRMVFVDVGAAGGLDEIWKDEADNIHCVFFEPGEAAAADLREIVKFMPSAEVMETALSDRTGEQRIYLTRFPQCTSLLEPDEELLRNYTVSPCFEVQRTVSVSCKRYDEILGAPAPDIIKIDVQGAEYLVLQGFGRHLDTVLAIELEAHFYPIYKNQKLLGDLVAFLADHGLRLRNLRPQMNFNRDFLEVNAFFTRDNPVDKRKSEILDLIHQKWGIHDHDARHLLAYLSPA